MEHTALKRQEMRKFASELDDVVDFPSAAIRPSALRSIERRLARLVWETNSPRERAELLASITRAFVVLAAMRTAQDPVGTTSTEQAEIEQVFAAALRHLRSTQHDEYEPIVF